MFSYYGSKTNLLKHYPKPLFETIIEPFAGSARYALNYFDRNVILIDKYETIVNIWRWLQKCSPSDINGLPRIKAGELIEDYKFDCQEAADLCGFLVGFSSKQPRKVGTSKLLVRPNFMNYRLNQIRDCIPKIKHWKIICGSYEEAENIEGTWYIDPPYEGEAGSRYVFGSRQIDYIKLASWCKSRNGQVIVCEATGAVWLPFIPIGSQRTNKKMSGEAIWSNIPTAHDNIQQKLIL